MLRPRSRIVTRLPASNSRAPDCDIEVLGRYSVKMCLAGGGWMWARREEIPVCLSGGSLRPFESVSQPRMIYKINPPPFFFVISIQFSNLPLKSHPLLSPHPQPFPNPLNLIINLPPSSPTDILFSAKKKIPKRTPFLTKSIVAPGACFSSY